MNVAALLQDSPSDDSHRRRPAPPPSNNGGNGSQEHVDRGAGLGGGGAGAGERAERAERAERIERAERGERGERGSGGQWPSYDRSRVQSQSQSSWPPPHPRPAPSSTPSTPISTETSPYAHPKEPPSWSQPVGNPYPQTPSTPYDTASSAPPPRLRADSGAASHPPPTTGPGVPPPLPPSGSSYMPPPDFPPHLHRPPPPTSSGSSSHYSTPVPVAGQPRLPMSHSPPIGGSPYAAGPPPPASSSTPRRPQSQLATPQPPHVHGPPSSHPSPAMASLQNPTSGPWGPGAPGPGMVDGRERDSLRDRTHLPLERERPADRDRDMNIPPRDRERDWDTGRERPRPKLPPAGPGIPPPPLTGPGTSAPPPLAPGVPPIIGPGISEDPHKIAVSSAPASGVPSRAHSRSQLSKDDIAERPKDLERASRIPERDMPPAGLGRAADYPPREYPPHRREPGEIMVPAPPNRREREEYIGPGGPSGSSRLPPPAGHPADYRPPGDYGREPPPPDYRRSSGEYRQVDYRREPPYPPGEYREPQAGYRRDLPPGPSSSEYRRDAQPGDYRDPRREQHPSLDYRRDPALGEYRRGVPPPDYRGPPDYRDTRRERDLPLPTSSGHSPEAYRRDPQDYPSSRRNSNESRRERDKEREREMMSERERVDPRRGEPGAGPVIPPGERHPRRSPYQSREPEREFHRRPEPGDYRRDPASGPIPTDYRGPPPENYRPSEYRPPHPDYHREPLPPDFPPQRRDHHPYPPDLRRDDYSRPPHPHAPPGPPQIRSEYRPPPPPEHRGQEYRHELPPRPPQDYRRDPGPADYRGPPGSLPPPGDYLRQGPPPGQEFKSRESGEIIPPRDYPRRDRERELPREGDYSRPPAGDYPRRRDEDYMIRPSQQPGPLPPGPGMPGRASTPSNEMYVKHPSERERDRERERWEQKERERNADRGHYPPPASATSTSGHPPPSHHHNHPHPHPKQHPHHPHHHSHHHHVIHQHQHSHHGHGTHQHPSPPGHPTGPGGGIPVGQGSPPSQSVGPPPPSQRQLQGQFPTRFVSVHAQPGSRIGSPIPGPVPGPSGSSRDMRKDVGSNISVGKDVKKIRSGVPPGPGVGPGGRRERDEREKERDIHQSYPQPPPQPLPHRDGQGRVLGHGYPHGPHRPHGQPPYDDFMMVDDVEQQMQMQNQHHIHPPPPPHPQQQGPILQHPHPLPSYPLPPHVGYYPSQEAVDELWPPEQPDKEVKSRVKINLGTFVYPHTPFPYYFDVGEWVGVNANLKEQNERGVVVKGVELGKEKEKVVVAENKMDVDGEERSTKGQEKEKESEVEKVAVEKETEVEAAEVDQSVEKEKESQKEEGNDKEKEKEKEGERGKEREEEKPKEAKEKEKEKNGEAKVAEQVDAQKDGDDDILDVETRATILIPNGYIPREKPPTPHIWGGGVIGRPINPQRRAPPTPNQAKPDSPVRPKKRRIYTDDSDLFLCALHSGWLTWSASARARDTGKDVRIEVRVIRCAGTGAGSVFAVGAGAFAGKYAPAENSVVSAVSPYRKNKITKVPVVRKEEIVGRFIGGWGEKCFIREFEGETDDEDNDGRGLVSAGWGSGHDGSAIEVVNVELVEKGTAKKSPGTGRRNRAQRLLEYSERRAAVLGLQRLAAAPRLAGRKRRRNWDPYPPTRRLPNANVLDMIPELREDDMVEDERPEFPMEPERREEASLMGVRTVTFGTGLAGDMRLGYKYQPDVLKDILFPAPSPSISDRPPPRKRRRTTIVSEDILMDVDAAESEPPAPTPNRPVILETPKESYLLSLTHGSEFSLEGRQYDISLILEGEVEEDREDAVVLHVADKNAVKAAQEDPPLTPPPADEPEESKFVPVVSANSDAMDGIDNPTEPSNDESREKPLNPTQDATRSSPSITLPKTDMDLPPSRSNEGTSTPNKDTPASKTQGDKSEPVLKTLQKVAFKHPVAQVLQRRVGEDMFRFTEEGVNIADGEDSMRTEWLVQVKSWKWATRKIVRV